MNRGKAVQVGSPVELYERPATAFAASFLGKSNFIRRGGRSYSLRPEKIDAAPAGSGAGDNRLAGTIRAITYMGATLKLMVDVPGHGAIEVHVPTWRNTGQFSESQAVDLCWSNDAQVEVEGGDGEEAGARPA
jgi:putative spermidine/putrescine transport system ATP-binding protein